MNKTEDLVRFKYLLKRYLLVLNLLRDYQQEKENLYRRLMELLDENS